jgi:hypothetical protein
MNHTSRSAHQFAPYLSTRAPSRVSHALKSWGLALLFFFFCIAGTAMASPSKQETAQSVGTQVGAAIGEAAGTVIRFSVATVHGVKAGFERALRPSHPQRPPSASPAR